MQIQFYSRGELTTLLCLRFFDSSVYKNPIGDAFEEGSEQAHLLVIYGIKLAKANLKLFFRMQ